MANIVSLKKYSNYFLPKDYKVAMEMARVLVIVMKLAEKAKERKAERQAAKDREAKEATR